MYTSYANSSFVLLLLLAIPFSIQAQEDPMRVVRCAAIEQRIPVLNVYVDEANVKWVANTKGVY